MSMDTFFVISLGIGPEWSYYIGKYNIMNKQNPKIVQSIVHMAYCG